MLRRVLVISGLAGLLGCHALLALRAGGTRPERTDLSVVWRLAVAGANAAMLTTPAAGAAPLVVLQAPGRLVTASVEGRILNDLRRPGLVAAATGDVDGDGADEIVVVYSPPTRVEVYTSFMSLLWSADFEEAQDPTRVLVADLDGDRRAEVALGGTAGVDTLSSHGQKLWGLPFEQPASGEQGELRGLDDLRAGDQRLVAVGRRDGWIALADAQGKTLWSRQIAGGLRRLRTADLDGDKQGELLLGTENGEYQVLDAEGKPKMTWNLGEAVTEIRRVEWDGQPGSGEVALAGKRGAVQVLGRFGASDTLLRVDAGDKVSALGGVDVDGDGREELVVGCENGRAVVFDSRGAHLADLPPMGKVERVLSAPGRGAARRAIVVGGSEVVALRFDREVAPLWYSPIAAAMLGFLALGGVALVLGLLPSRSQAPASDPASLLSATLEEARARIDALIAAGHITPAQAAERLEQLGQRLAAAQASNVSPPPPPPPPPPAAS